MHKFQKTLFVSSFCMLVSINTYGETDDGTSGIKALMTPEQYQTAGLHKLTGEEREALYKWLRQYAGEAQPGPAPAATHSPAATTAIVAVPVAKTEAADRPAVVATPPAVGAAVAVAPAATTTTAMVAQPAPKQVVPQKKQPIPAAEDENFGFPEPPVDPLEDRDALHAKILPPFRGWSGKTVFKLDNGQVWKQRTSSRHTYTGDDTRVVISKNSWGFFEMRLVAADRSVGVKRVK